MPAQDDMAAGKPEAAQAAGQGLVSAPPKRHYSQECGFPVEGRVRMGVTGHTI